MQRVIPLTKGKKIAYQRLTFLYDWLLLIKKGELIMYIRTQIHSYPFVRTQTWKLQSYKLATKDQSELA